MITDHIRHIQSWLGLEVDGIPGANTFTGISIELGIEPQTYTKPEILAAICAACGISTEADEETFWKAVASTIEAKATKNVEKNDFYVLEIPASKSPVIPENIAVVGLLAKFGGGLLEKLKAGMKSKGTFTTGLSTLLGSVLLITKGLEVVDTNTSMGLIVGGINGIIAGIGLMLGRDGSTSDEAAGAKKGVQ